MYPQIFDDLKWYGLGYHHNYPLNAVMELPRPMVGVTYTYAAFGGARVLKYTTLIEEA